MNSTITITHSISPDLKPKLSKESLSIHGRCVSMQPQSTRRALQQMERWTPEEEAEEEEEELSGVKRNLNKQIRSNASEDHAKAQVLSRNIHQDPDQIHKIVASLKNCASRNDLHRGSRIHAHIIRTGSLRMNVFLGSSLVSMYAKCGSLAKAQNVLNMLPAQNAISWNALIAGYVQHGQGEKAVRCYDRMQHEGISPTIVTLICILKACGSTGNIDKGKEIHSEIVRTGLLNKEMAVHSALADVYKCGNALIDMYAKCGLLTKAREVFDTLTFRNVVSWNTLMTGYVEHGQGEQPLKCFEQMQLEGFFPDEITYVCALKASAIVGAAEKGGNLHAEIVKDGLINDIVVGTALIDMYAKCGLLEKAQEVFDMLPCPNVVSWSALMAGYAQHGNGEQAIKCFEQMRREGFSPDAVTYICILKACGRIGAVDKGKEIHTEIVRDGLLNTDIVLGTALVDMYAKCGLLAQAEEVFEKLPVRNVVSWNALIAGYTLLGKAHHVFQSFERMTGEGIKPDLITFTIVLNACTHSGLVGKGQVFFETMRTEYGLVPTVEHYACMFDLFARTGHLDKAVTVIKEMPFSADLALWLNMLGACRKWENMDLGRLAFQHAVQLDEKEAAAYVCMGDIYATSQEDGD